MGDHSAHNVGSKAPEDEVLVAQVTEEVGGTEVKEGFETSMEEGRGGGGPDRMYFFFCFVLFCFGGLGEKELLGHSHYDAHSRPGVVKGYICKIQPVPRKGQRQAPAIAPLGSM